MAHWRMKLMSLDEWSSLQEKFGEFQLMMKGHPDLAMFSKGKAADDLTEIYITGPKIELMERFSPGDWQDAEAPAGEGVALLVGTVDSWERLGVTKPGNPD